MHISSPLSVLLTNCCKEGVFPEVLKIGKVVPIFKSGDKHDVNNYRPISLLSIFSKIFEKALKSRITGFMESFKILSPYQYGFRSGASTSVAVLDLVSSIESYKDLGNHSIALFLDLRKAFDMVDHKLLLCKLEHYGIRGPALLLLSSYLHDRIQFTVLQNNESLPKAINCGVPQGSVLGPLLFLIFINDLCNSSNANIRLFADDTVVVVSHRDLNILSQHANEAIENVYSWMTNNKLLLNPEKTTAMFFHNRKKTNEVITPSIKLKGINIPIASNVKYLGFIIDNELSFRLHLSQLEIKLRKWVGVFWKIGCFLDKKTKYIVYNSLFCSHVLYGLEVFGNTSKTALKKLQTLQNRAVKALFRLPKLYPSIEIINTLGIQSINTLFLVRASLMLWKIHKLLIHYNIHVIFINPTTQFGHKYNTRGQSDFKLAFNKSSFTSSISFQLFLLWNTLPSHIKEENSFCKYKIQISKHFLSSV